MSDESRSGGTLLQRSTTFSKDARFRIRVEGRTSRVFDFAYEVMIVGKGADCEIPISDDARVSTRHAKLRRVPQGIQVTDLGSTNGIHLCLPDSPDDEARSRLSSEFLWRPGGVALRLGETQLTLEWVRRPDRTDGDFQGMVGHAPRMLTAYQRIANYAPFLMPVYLHGETGTGKELAARALHQLSARGEGPFLALNCAGLTEERAWSELFGHKRGAYTGAGEDYDGHFRRATGGTLFLDEVAELAPAIQAMLLRAIGGEIMPMGAKAVERVDVRLVLATHEDLAQLVRAKRFRSDLYFRIATTRVELPPLLERREDLPALVEFILQRVPQGASKRLAEGAMEKVLGYTWPGNVRELEARLLQAVANSSGRAEVGADDLELDDELAVAATGPDSAWAMQLQGKTEAEAVAHLRRAAVTRCGTLEEAAKALGISERTLRGCKPLGEDDEG